MMPDENTLQCTRVSRRGAAFPQGSTVVCVVMTTTTSHYLLRFLCGRARLGPGARHADTRKGRLRAIFFDR